MTTLGSAPPATGSPTAWRQATRVGVAAARESGRRQVSSPSALFTVVVFYLMVGTVLSRLWVAAAESGGGEVVGYTAAALVWYIYTTEAAVNAIPFRLIEDIGNDITGGRIETELLVPAPVLAVRLAGELGAALVRLGVVTATAAVVATALAGPPPSLTAAALGVPSLILALAGNLAAHHLFASAAFWLGETRSAWFLYQKLVFVVGGMLLPLEILPPAVELGAKVLPFAAFAYAPGRLMSGHAEAWWLAVQAGWLVVLTVGATLAFRAGERHLVKEGA